MNSIPWYQKILFSFSSFLLLMASVSGCGSENKAHPVAANVLFPPVDMSLEDLKEEFRQTGMASWYGPGFYGRKTASGERFKKHLLTCAHRSLPFGTELLVTNLENGKSVEVIVNDRGPFVRDRILDLSPAAAKEIGLIHSGSAKVELKVLLAKEESLKPYLE
ncbi:MAG: septal ring lytic transglycosylase RlpA family protein [Deltaproteobacteria bacterium]|nr:septal ring lytic transglycosylase RlpA family protein [Deltaproteobacteria bacterium]